MAACTHKPANAMRYHYTISAAQWISLLAWGMPLTAGSVALLGLGERLGTHWLVPRLLLGLLTAFYALPCWWGFARALRRARSAWLEVTDSALIRVDPLEPAPERDAEVPWETILELSRYRVGLRGMHWAFTYRRPDGAVGVVHIEPEGLRQRGQVWQALVQRSGLQRLAATPTGECYARPAGGRPDEA